MAQTPAVYIQEGRIIPDTTSTTRTGGDVVEVGTIPLVCAPTDPNLPGVNSLCVMGVFDVPKDTSTFSAGDAVYWDNNGSPVTGTALSGCATSTASGNNLMGLAIASAATGVTYVRTELTAYSRTTSIGGTVTADSITGSDSSLGIGGLAGNSSAGGDVAIAGGVAAAGAFNGGAVTIAGGAGPTAGNVGGAVSLISGAGDVTNGTAGAVVIDSGAGNVKGSITIGTNATVISFVHQPRMPQATLAANGGNIATAAALTAGVTVVSGTDNAKGVQLPSCAAGVRCVVINQNTDKTLKVYPPTGKAIGAAGANNAVTVVANAIGTFECYDTNTYYAGSMSGIVS